MLTIKVPYPSLVLPIGISGSGKTTFCEAHFKKPEILSSDFFRYMIANDEGDQSVSKDAFEALNFIASKRMKHNKLVVIDATNVQGYARTNMLRLAKEHSYLTVAIVLDVSMKLCKERILERERKVPDDVIERQHNQFKDMFSKIYDEGFEHIYFLKDVQEIDNVSIRLI